MKKFTETPAVESITEVKLFGVSYKDNLGVVREAPIALVDKKAYFLANNTFELGMDAGEVITAALAGYGQKKK